MAVTFTDADFVLLIDLSALCALRVMRETSEVDAVRARIFFLPKAVEDYIRSEDDDDDDVFAYLFLKRKICEVLFAVLLLSFTSTFC